MASTESIQTSYGIICYREESTSSDDFILDENFNILEPTKNYKIILVQRSYSIGYVEFLRAKYEVYDVKYITHLIQIMTVRERMLIKELMNFDKLNEMLGISQKSSQYHKAKYSEAAEKFKNIADSGLLKNILDNCSSSSNSTEWGIPKGKPQYQHESYLHCAIREFCEESNLTTDDIQIFMNIDPLVEKYTSFNGVTYQHIYYFAKFIGDPIKPLLNESNTNLSSEIRDIAWISQDEIDNYIRDYHVDKKRVLHEAFAYLQRIESYY